MPLNSGPPRECTCEARCGVAIGPFRNANNGQTSSIPRGLYKGTVLCFPDVWTHTVSKETNNRHGAVLSQWLHRDPRGVSCY